MGKESGAKLRADEQEPDKGRCQARRAGDKSSDHTELTTADGIKIRLTRVREIKVSTYGGPMPIAQVFGRMGQFCTTGLDDQEPEPQAAVTSVND